MMTSMRWRSCPEQPQQCHREIHQVLVVQKQFRWYICCVYTRYSNAKALEVESVDYQAGDEVVLVSIDEDSMLSNQSSSFDYEIPYLTPKYYIFIMKCYRWITWSGNRDDIVESPVPSGAVLSPGFNRCRRPTFNRLLFNQWISLTKMFSIENVGLSSIKWSKKKLVITQSGLRSQSVLICRLP